MPEQDYEKTMKKTEQIEGFALFLRDWTIPEIAIELGKTESTIRNWHKNYGWRRRKKAELYDIEKEMHDKVVDARNKIIDIGTQTLDDVFIKDAQGKIVGVSIQIERVADLKSVAETLLKAGGVADRVETKVEKVVDGEITVNVETVSAEMAAEIGKAIAIKESMEVDEDVEQ